MPPTSKHRLLFFSTSGASKPKQAKPQATVKVTGLKKVHVTALRSYRKATKSSDVIKVVREALRGKTLGDVDIDVLTLTNTAERRNSPKGKMPTGPQKTRDPELESLLAQARAARQQGPRAPTRSEEERRQLGEAYARVAHHLTEDERAELHRRMRREAHPDEQIE